MITHNYPFVSSSLYYRADTQKKVQLFRPYMNVSNVPPKGGIRVIQDSPYHLIPFSFGARICATWEGWI